MNYALDVYGDKNIQNPTEADIRQAVSSLADEDGAFLILGTSDMTYIQAVVDRQFGFDLEYQEDDTEHHYRARRNDFTVEEIIKAMTSYSTGADDWKKTVEWELIEL